MATQPSPRNIKKGTKKFVGVELGRLDGGRADEQEETVSGRKRENTSSICVMAGEAITTNGKQ